MFRGISARKEKLLRQRLRQEAEQASPAVSETFHERLCRAIRRGKIDDSGVCPEPLPERLSLRYLAPAIAAACLILMVGALWQTLGPIVRPNRVHVVPPQVARAPAPPTDGPKIPVDAMSLTQLGDDTLARVSAVVDTATVSPQWAYLDHDARLAMQMFADRFPFNTSRSQGAGEDSARTPN